MERYNVITLGTALEDITARYPDKISIIYEDAKLTYGQVDKYANRLIFNCYILTTIVRSKSW